MRLDKIYFKGLFALASFLLIGGMIPLRADTPPEFQNKSNISKSYIQEEMLTPATVVKKSYDKKLNLYQYRLSNNVRVNLKPIPLLRESEAEASPRIAFRASFGRGE